MSKKSIPDVYLRAVLISRGPSILTVFHQKWSAFTLPMSKIKTWMDENGEQVTESAFDTTTRAMVEAIGRPLLTHEEAKLHPLHTLDPFNQSPRDGDWKCYHIELYQFELPADEASHPIGGLPFAWMTLDQMKSSRPITTTLEHIASKLRGE